MNNFITNSKETITLKERLQELISGRIYNSLEENSNVILKILVGLQVDKYLSDIIEVENKDNNLSNEEYFTQFIKSLGYAINHSEMDNEEFYKQIEFFIKLLQQDRLIVNYP